MSEETPKFSIDETTGEVLQHDGFLRYVIAKSLYALVERLANTEAQLINTNAQLAAQAKRIAELEAENAKLETLLNQAKLAVYHYAVEEKQSPAPAAPDARKAKYAIGDKVLVIAKHFDFLHVENAFGVISQIGISASGMYEVEFPSTGNRFPFHEKELEPYTES